MAAEADGTAEAEEKTRFRPGPVELFPHSAQYRAGTRRAPGAAFRWYG